LTTLPVPQSHHVPLHWQFIALYAFLTNNRKPSLHSQTENAAAIDLIATGSSTEPSYAGILIDGLWRSNPGIVQLLGLCPLLAVSNSLVNGMGLGLATLLTLLVSSTVISACRNWIKPEIRIPAFVLLIASVVTAIDLTMNAWLHDLHLILGIFIPLIVTNCMIIGRAESFASRHPLRLSLMDAFAHGFGFMLVLIVLGGVRELLGFGSLLRDAHLLFGPAAETWMIQLWNPNNGLLIALLPPGAFMLLGLLLAAKNLINPE